MLQEVAARSSAKCCNLNKHKTTLQKRTKRAITVRVYTGFGYKHQLQLFGHVMYAQGAPERPGKTFWANAVELKRLFFVRPVPNADVVLNWIGKQVHTQTDAAGFFKLEWESDVSVEAGEWEVEVHCYTKAGEKVSGTGNIIVPHVTQLGIISDIDDTIMVSHSSTIFRRLWVLFKHSAAKRKTFTGMVELYRRLQYADTRQDEPNPFFYVSSSEWNLYVYLQQFMVEHAFPKGVLLLSAMKRWYEVFKTGKTKHGGKFIRIVRILEAFPKQKFVLIGDNSQKDPEIYAALAENFPQRIKAVYIRIVVPKKQREAELQLQVVKQLSIPCYFFTDANIFSEPFPK